MLGFRSVMQRDRFLNSLSFFSLSNSCNAKPRDNTEHDRTFKICPIFRKACDTLAEIILSRNETISRLMYDSFQRQNKFTYVHARKTNQVGPEIMRASRRKNLYNCTISSSRWAAKQLRHQGQLVLPAKLFPPCLRMYKIENT